MVNPKTQLPWMILVALPLLAALWYQTTQVLAFQPARSIISRPRRRSPWSSSSSALLMAAIPVLKDWTVLPNGRVEGVLVNHPEWPAGAIISTSPLTQSPDDAVAAGKEVILVETLSGSRYLLLNNKNKQDPPTRQTTTTPTTTTQTVGAATTTTFPPPITTGSYVEKPAATSTNTRTSSYDDTSSDATRDEPVASTAVPARWGWRNSANTNTNVASTAVPESWGWSSANSNADTAGEKGVTNFGSETRDDNQEEGGGGGGLSKTKQLMEQVKDAGIAGVISYALWELGFWAVSVPVCIAAYREVTGHWPDVSNPEDIKQLGAEAFAFVNVARFAVPLRIGLALSTTPWIETNIVERFLSSNKSPGGKN